MNALQYETSPYLLQHANNPVDWFPWGEAAFEKARKEDKPIFLSIGYSTCHWCHVMAEESFEDQQVAKFLNEHFVSIKVDREERPDIDGVYMAVCQALTGSGGWPMTIFMDAEQRPFFAGTYYPKESAMGMVGFLELIQAIDRTWKSKRNALTHAAEQILKELQHSHETDEINSEMKAAGQNSGQAVIKGGILQLKQTYDSVHGGFGRTPKFPSGHNLLFLMDQYGRSGDKDLLAMAEKTLLQMYKGGLFDHVGGGFSRYSTDQFFLAPHFEKMVYDNALLLRCYGTAYALTKKQVYKQVIERTVGWMQQEMTSGGGGFYSSQDADSQGEEGKFYTFTAVELLEVLGPQDGKRFLSHYGVTEDGNFEGKNILNLLGHEEAEEIEQELLCKVYQYRKNRFPLHTDDKILMAWNGMAVWALAGLSQQLGDKQYLNMAKDCMTFLLNKAESMDAGQKGKPAGLSENLFVSYRRGAYKGVGLLDDYAWIICGLLALYEATSKEEYLKKAVKYGKTALKRFFDEEKGGFFQWGKENETLILNQKEIYDGAMPSGNSVMAWNLVRLCRYLDMGKANKSDEENGKLFFTAAEKQFGYLCQACKAYPAGHTFFLLALSDWLHPDSFFVCRGGICGPVKGGAERG